MPTTVLENKPKVAIARMWQVVIHNDDFTDWNFVVRMLITLFGLNFNQASIITHSVHHSGKGIAGLYTKEVAETKIIQATRMAEANDHPLLLTCTPV